MATRTIRKHTSPTQKEKGKSQMDQPETKDSLEIPAFGSRPGLQAYFPEQIK